MRRVREIMASSPEVLAPTESVQSAAQRMKSLDLGSMPVCEDGRLVGALTDRDMVLRVTAEGRDPARTAVREVMSRDVACVAESQDAAQAAELMRRAQVRRLPVVDRHRRVVGIVSLGDFARAGDELTGEILKGVSLPFP
jgi:CBS domain-containing protein